MGGHSGWADATSLGLRHKPQFLVRFGGFAAKTSQKNVVGRQSLPTPHRRGRTLQQPWAFGLAATLPTRTQH
jgi:hypothetical protein